VLEPSVRAVVSTGMGTFSSVGAPFYIDIQLTSPRWWDEGMTRCRVGMARPSGIQVSGYVFGSRVATAGGGAIAR